METLGLTIGADAKMARRAYLKLIRKHKPDRDPEAFKRIREAFETCKVQLGIRSVELACKLAEPPAAPTPESAAAESPVDVGGLPSANSVLRSALGARHGDAEGWLRAHSGHGRLVVGKGEHSIGARVGHRPNA